MQLNGSGGILRVYMHVPRLSSASDFMYVLGNFVVGLQYNLKDIEEQWNMKTW
jgi:hypothetical protein